MACERINVLGVGISVLNMKAALSLIVEALEKKRKGYICVTGVHGVTEAQADASFRTILNHAFLCTPDGMPMVWMGKFAGKKTMNRVYGPDLMLAVLEESVRRGYRNFFYGGANGAAEALKEAMTRRFHGLQVCGTYEPPFRPLNTDESHALVSFVAAAKPDIVWVGLSTPKQERFMAEFLPRLETTLMIGVGAAFDFHCGRVKQAPRWMQRSGLEWSFRLCQEPRRLWKRYLKNNPLFVWRVFCQMAGLRRYALEERN
jgi:N-acetylglucosaminyldiphosphoundecaprenol N-acetyl-beta-D-mannosaminyltransferase